MKTFYKSNDGKQFSSREDCELYERRLTSLVFQFVQVSLSEKVPGKFLSEKIGVPREFLPNVSLMDPNLEIIERLKGAQHLAEFMDSYIALGRWLEKVQGTESTDAD